MKRRRFCGCSAKGGDSFLGQSRELRSRADDLSDGGSTFDVGVVGLPEIDEFYHHALEKHDVRGF